MSICWFIGFPYAGLQFGKQCRCGHSFGRFGHSNGCDTPCSGNSSETCGGWLAQNIYFTGVGGITNRMKVYSNVHNCNFNK